MLLFAPLALLLPTLHWRRQAGVITVRLAMWLCGMRLVITGLNNLPKGGCVVVANHSSYLDGPILASALPTRFCLVIKREAENIPAVGFFLRRVDHLLVERHNPRQAAKDAKKIVERLANGEAVGIFAEGTFHAAPGIHRFKPGGFVAAVRNQRPVVPVAIRGTRHILPDQRRTLRPGTVRIDVLPAIQTTIEVTPTNASDTAPTSRQQANAVAEQARETIAHHIQEPLV